VNIKVVLEYEGTAFAGWQRQPGRRTVEGELARSIHEVTGAEPVLRAAGRTDAGAHALGQVVSFRLDGRLSPARLTAAINARLPEDVAVVGAETVPDSFHARYSARWRRYRYRYLDRPARPALQRRAGWHVRRPLDVDAMREGARALVGEHDWSSFCSASEPASGRVRRMRSVDVARRGCGVELELVGEGFLRGLARGVAGALREVGIGRRPPVWIAEVLAAKDRSRSVKTAPAHGLTLVEVIY
jgi:tRNA pseudouridine38-40 synthase